MAADLGCTEEGAPFEFIDYEIFTPYVLKFTSNFAGTQSLSIFRLASFETNKSGNDIYPEAFMSGRRKAEHWDGHCPQKRHSALHFNTYDSKFHKVNKFLSHTPS